MVISAGPIWRWQREVQQRPLLSNNFRGSERSEKSVRLKISAVKTKLQWQKNLPAKRELQEAAADCKNWKFTTAFLLFSSNWHFSDVLKYIQYQTLLQYNLKLFDRIVLYWYQTCIYASLVRRYMDQQAQCISSIWRDVFSWFCHHSKSPWIPVLADHCVLLCQNLLPAMLPSLKWLFSISNMLEAVHFIFCGKETSGVSLLCKYFTK